MNKKINFSSIKQYNCYIIEISKEDFQKINNCISLLKNKYDKKILTLHNIEKEISKSFKLDNQIKFIKKQKDLLLEIILDVLKFYEKELDYISVVFLSGSFARGTNKMSSDIDLHFLYKNNNYNYIYEEIVCYIISRIVNKSRDSIDPTFIFNIQKENKNYITKKMDDTKLNIILKYKNQKIKYSYKYGKKRRFYLQYVNSRDIKDLFNYLSNQIKKQNYEWCHCFEILKGKNEFEQMYNSLYQLESDLINADYIKQKIKLLRNNIVSLKEQKNKNAISEYKKYYQSEIFKLIYEYVSIIRFILIKENIEIKYLNLIEILNLISKKNLIEKNIFIQIYKYMWNLEKLAIYCYENKINYGLHNDDRINFSTTNLDKNWKILKDLILNDLERLGDING